MVGAPRIACHENAERAEVFPHLPGEIHMFTEGNQDSYHPRTCQDCVGIGRAWIEGILQDCPECGGSGWESALGIPSRWGFVVTSPSFVEDRKGRAGHP